MSKLCRTIVPVFIAALATAAPAAAEDRQPAEPELYRRMVACKDLADAAERLACYDRQVAAFDTATRNRDIVIADREEVRKTRRGLFGFTAPLGRLLGFGAGDEDQDAVKRLETAVVSVSSRDGNLVLTFAEAGTWEQNDRYGFPLRPKAGDKAVITRGALGAYFVSVDGMAGIKMRRVQ